MLDKKAKILVVDDAPMVRRIMKNVLSELGYRNVITAEDGRQAWNILQKEKVDFVITDWNMPNMTGIELVQKIRGDEKLKNLPVLMVTAEAKKENVIMALKTGVNNYIVKPFKKEDVMKKMQLIFKAKKS